ncbi:hypothetical protein ACFE04_015051 [Oxalis oulophora]
MASVAPNSILISQNTSLISPRLPFSKLKNTSKLNPFQSNSLFYNKTNNCNMSCVAAAKTKLSDSEIQIHQDLTSNTTVSSSWSEFAKNVSGEWDGFQADFTIEGTAVELPDSVVPEAYKEWEVRVFDWQTQCPTLAQPDNHAMMYKVIKLLPTVGCEADAATRYTIDETNIGGVDNQVSAFAYQSGGCYFAVKPAGDKLLELEHCLINPKDKESRVRIVQVVLMDEGKIVLKSIRVFCELWYGPFRNGDQLGGCSIRNSAFATTPVVDASEVCGVWQRNNAVARFDSSDTNVQEFLDNGMDKTVRSGSNLILLPSKLWSSLNEGEDGKTCCEVGWIFDDKSAITSTCILSCDAKYKSTIKQFAYGYQQKPVIAGIICAIHGQKPVIAGNIGAADNQRG